MLKLMLIALLATALCTRLGGADRVTGKPFATRSVVHATQGMAATSQPLATMVALDVLKGGGNAIDAAIAANACLGLMEPTGCGIGGDLFAIVWDAESKKLYGLNGSGRSPQSLTLEQLKHFNKLPKRTKQVYNGPMLLTGKKPSNSRTHDRKNVKSVPKDIVRGLHQSDIFGTTVRKIRTKRGTRNSSSKGTLSSGRSRSSTRSKGAHEEYSKELEFDTKKYVKNVLPLVDQKKKKNVVRLFSPSTRQKIYQGRFFEPNP